MLLQGHNQLLRGELALKLLMLRLHLLRSLRHLVCRGLKLLGLLLKKRGSLRRLNLHRLRSRSWRWKSKRRFVGLNGGRRNDRLGSLTLSTEL